MCIEHYLELVKPTFYNVVFVLYRVFSINMLFATNLTNLLLITGNYVKYCVLIFLNMACMVHVYCDLNIYMYSDHLKLVTVSC